MLLVEDSYRLCQNDKKSIEKDLKIQRDENFNLKNYIQNLSLGKENPINIFESEIQDIKEKYKIKAKEFREGEVKKIKESNSKKISTILEQNKKLKAEYANLKNAIINTVNAFKSNDEGLEKFIQDLADLESNGGINSISVLSGFNGSERTSQNHLGLDRTNTERSHDLLTDNKQTVLFINAFFYKLINY